VGDLDAESLLAELRDMGIDVDCSAEQLTLLARCRANSRMLSCMLALLQDACCVVSSAPDWPGQETPE
jgi:hypothetical protein